MPRDRKTENKDRRNGKHKSRRCKKELSSEESSRNEYMQSENSQTEQSSQTYNAKNKKRYTYEEESEEISDPYTPSGRLIVISSPAKKSVIDQLASVTSTDTIEKPVRRIKKKKIERNLTPEKRRSRSSRPCKREQSLSPNGKRTRHKKRSHSSVPENRKNLKHRQCKSPLKKRSSKDKDVRTLNKKKHSDEKCAPSCPLCEKTFEFPILLKCCHTFCKDCVTVLVETSDGKSFDCPICEIEIPLAGGDEELFCPNFVVLQTIGYDDEINDVICSACTMDNEATYFCENCADLLCDECTDAHVLVKFTKDHLIKEISSDTNLNQFVKKRYFCTEHSDEELVLHCVTCEQTLCEKCAKNKHSGDSHECVKIVDAARLSRKEMQRKLYNLKSHTPSLEIALLDIKQVKKILLQQVSTVREEISESIKRLEAALKDRKQTLLNNVDNVYKNKLADLKKQKLDIAIELERYESATRTLNLLESHDNSVELLQMKATIDKSLKSLDKSKLKARVCENTFLLKSNELDVKTAIRKHGEITQDNKIKGIKKQSSPIVGEEVNNGWKAMISSDFDEDAPDEYTNTAVQNSAKKLKTKANWMIVQSRVPDIIQYGVDKGYIEESQTSSVRSENSILNSNRLQRAKHLRAKANWHILISHLSVKASKKWDLGSKNQKQRNKKLYASKEHERKNTVEIDRIIKTSKKALRRRAIYDRTQANWLLLKSRLTDIVDFGKITGVLPYARQNWSSVFSKKPRSKTISKLKRYRAITLRARANWLLVTARLKDIVQYPKNKNKSSYSDFSIHDSLLLNRAKAARNKRIAGEVRATANWLIVKTRLADIVLYGKYLKYRQNRSHSPIKDTKICNLNSPKKNTTAISINSKLQYLKKFNSTPDLRLNIDKTTHDWDVLIHNGGNCSPAVRRIHFDRESHSKKKRDKQSKDFNDKTSGESQHVFAMNGKCQSLDSLLPPATHKRVFKPLRFDHNAARLNWIHLIKGTKTSSRKWDKVIIGSSFVGNEDVNTKNIAVINNNQCKHNSGSNGSSLEGYHDAIKHWLCLVDGIKTQSRRVTSQHHWNSLIGNSHVRKFDSAVNDKNISSKKITNSKHPRSLSREQDRNWIALINGPNAGKSVFGTKPNLNTQKDHETNWHILINGTKPDDTEQINDTKPDDTNQMKQTAKWQALINGTKTDHTAQKKHKANWDILLNGTRSDEISYKNWNILISKTKPDISMLKPYSNWRELIDGMSNHMNESNKQNSNKLKNYLIDNPEIATAMRNWFSLINGTKAANTSNDNIRYSTGEVESELNESDYQSSRRWSDVLKGSVATSNGFKTVLQKIFKRSTNRSTRTTSSYESYEEPEDTVMAGTSSNDVIENWEALINDTATGSLVIKGNSASEEVIELWFKLLNGTVISANEKVEKSEIIDAQNWNKLISGTQPETMSRKSLSKESLVKENTLRTSSGKEADKKQNEAKKAKKSNIPLLVWQTLIRGTTASNDDDEAYMNWLRLIASSRDHSKDRNKTKNHKPSKKSKEMFYHWDKLIEGKINKLKKPNDNWDVLVASPGKASLNSTKSSVFRNWNRAMSKTPPLPKGLHAISSKPKDDALENWNRITDNVNVNKEDMAIENWKNLVEEKNPYEKYDNCEVPTGTKILLEKKKLLQQDQTRLLSLNVKNSKGEFHNVRMKLSSPDKSILSAHIAENKDGTYTIFCCPRTDNDFNMYVSLHGEQFQHEIKVINFYGSFAGIRKHEADLACRTISLLRWHLTPGLLTKKGDKVVPKNINSTN